MTHQAGFGVEGQPHDALDEHERVGAVRANDRSGMRRGEVTKKNND